MINQLPEVISSFSTQSQTTVSSLIRDMKIDKSDFSSLLAKLSSIRLSTSYSPSIFEEFSTINKEFFIDVFRDADLRMKTYFSAANTISLILNSMVDVLYSEIEKVEKDLNLYSVYIENYEFLSGKDDLYNSSYIEKFDTNLNNYQFDGYNFPIPDRDGVPFGEDGNGFVDKKTGTFKIGQRKDFINALGKINNIKIESNYSNYATTDTGFYNCLNDDRSDSWTVTVKSPVILNTKTDMVKKYVTYDLSYINGAKTSVEISFESPELMDCIQITPGNGNGIQLLQAVIFADQETSNTLVPFEPDYVNGVTGANTGQGELTTLPLVIPILSKPKLIESITEITFIKTLVKKIILIFNQPIYTRNERSTLSSELTSKALYEVAKTIKLSKKDNPDVIQDMVYNLFLKNNSVKEILKNNYFNESYYSFKYPYIKNNFLNKDYRKSYIKEKMEFDSLEKRWSSILSNVFENFLIHSLGDKNEYFDDSSYIESGSTSRSSYSFNSPGLVPAKNSNSMNNAKGQFIQAEAVSRSSKSIMKDLLLLENKNQYEYSFSLKSIEFGVVSSEYGSDNNKACFVSKKIPFNGHPVAFKCILNKENSNLDLGLSNFDLKNPISYELSISNLDLPARESDWIPILPYGQNFIDSEVLFFDEQTFEASTRFVFSQSKIEIYKDGYKLPKSQYVIKNNRIVLTNLDINSIYVCEYYVNLGLYGYDNLDLVKSNLFKETTQSYYDSNGQGEKFATTDYLGKVTLKNQPYVDEAKTAGAVYSSNSGTIFNSIYQGYNPVKVLMSDGSYAVNLTNYTKLNYLPEFPVENRMYFMQNGKDLVFNGIVTEPFLVTYDYVNFSSRFRVILRRNIKSAQYSGSLDSVILKAKTKNYDQYFDKLNKSLTRN